MNEPIFQLSKYGSMAFTVEDKMVFILYPDTLGRTKIESAHYAWTAIYRKYGSEWKIDCVTTPRKSN